MKIYLIDDYEDMTRLGQLCHPKFTVKKPNKANERQPPPEHCPHFCAPDISAIFICIQPIVQQKFIQHPFCIRQCCRNKLGKQMKYTVAVFLCHCLLARVPSLFLLSYSLRKLKYPSFVDEGSFPGSWLQICSCIMIRPIEGTMGREQRFQQKKMTCRSNDLTAEFMFSQFISNQLAVSGIMKCLHVSATEIKQYSSTDLTIINCDSHRTYILVNNIVKVETESQKKGTEKLSEMPAHVNTKLCQCEKRR